MQFFVFLFYFGFSSSDYDLFEPLSTSIPGEIGFWSLLGVATNMKNSINFSPDSSRQNGGICLRVPTTSSNWYSQFRVSVRKGSLNYILSDTSCPYWSISQLSNELNGISLNITRKNEEKVAISAHFLNHNQTKKIKLCKVNSENLTIQTTYSNNTISYQVLSDHNNQFEPCGDPISLSEDFSQFYFMFLAQNNNGIGSSEIYNHLLQIPSPYHETINITEINEINRQLILLNQNKHKTNKSLIPLAKLIIDEMEAANYKLSKVDSDNTTESIRLLLLEVRNRLKESLTTDDLQKLVHATIAVNLLRAEHKMEKRRMAFASINDELDNLKSVVDEKLKWLSQYVVSSMGEAKVSAIETLNGFVDATKNTENLPKEAKKHAKEIKSIWLPTLLYVISLIELVCYVAFFCIKRKKTHGFKKID